MFKNLTSCNVGALLDFMIFFLALFCILKLVHNAWGKIIFEVAFLFSWTFIFKMNNVLITCFHESYLRTEVRGDFNIHGTKFLRMLFSIKNEKNYDTVYFFFLYGATLVSYH